MKLVELNTNIQHAVFSPVQLEQKHMVRGQRLDPVYKANVLGHDLGQQLNHALQQAVQTHLKQLLAPILSRLRF